MPHILPQGFMIFKSVFSSTTLLLKFSYLFLLNQLSNNNIDDDIYLYDWWKIIVLKPKAVCGQNLLQVK